MTVTTSSALVPSANAGKWPALPALGNLDAYISAVNRMPMLTPEEELRYARALREHNDVEAAGRLVMSHLRVVVAVSRQYAGYGLPQGDLIQEGNIGLMKAVKRFDPDQGVRLVSYAMHWIKAEIHEYILKNWRMVKVATTKSQRKLFFNLRSLKQEIKAHQALSDGELYRISLTDSEIDQVADRLNVKREDVIEMETRLSGGDVMLDPTPADEESGPIGPIAYLGDHSNAKRQSKHKLPHCPMKSVQSPLCLMSCLMKLPPLWICPLPCEPALITDFWRCHKKHSSAPCKLTKSIFV